ncbi:MAG TPA: hypothetical protein VN783_11570 [Thermoanaerobaculia bacterium]|nr:hypothetical protein [Thermoanaerobaculia bacterium]
MQRNALSWLAAFFAASAAVAAGIDPNLLAGLKARSIGPAGMSGRVAAIDAVESNPDVVYVGAATGGVWKSSNGGLTFTPIFDDQPVAAIGAMAIFQANPSIVWIGTGEGNVRNSASVGNGIYRSVDAGATWQYLGLGGTERIHRIVLHPTNPDVAWVAALGREWGENPERGIYKTTDGGKSWRKVLYVDEKTGGADVAIDPSNPNKLFASTWQYRRWPYAFKSGGPGSGLWTSMDGGESWKRLSEDDGLPKGELGRIGLAISRSNPQVVYAMVEAKKSALLRSDDGGTSWKSVNVEPDVDPRPFYFGEIRVDPRFPARVFSVDFDIRISEDGGKTLARAPFSDQIHGDYHALWIDPNHPDRFYVGDDGGVAVSLDGGRTARFVTTLPLAQFYHVALDDEIPFNVYGGLQDNGSWRGPSASWSRDGLGSHRWTSVGGGDGFDTRPDPKDASIGYAMWQGGNLSRWDLKSGEAREIKPPAPNGTKLRFNWNAGFSTDPFDPATIYLGSQFLHRSTDRGETWSILGPDLTTNDPDWQKQDESGGLTLDVSGAENYTTILAIAPSPKERGVLWVGTDDGRLQVTRDGGQSWTSVEKNVPGVPANSWIPHVKASAYAGGTAFVVFDDHRRSNWATYLFRTDDYGKSWKSLAAAPVRAYAQSIEQDPVDPNLLFLGTEFGLWVSFDAGASWVAWRQGIPTVGVYDLAVHPRDGDLVVATHGRAIYVVDDIRPLRKLTADMLREKLHLFEIADVRQHWARPGPFGYGQGQGEFHGDDRPYGALIDVSLSAGDLPWQDDKLERERKEVERGKAGAAPAVAAGKKEDRPAGSKAEKSPAAAPAPEPKADEKADRDKKELTIEIRSAEGKLVRTLRKSAHRGLNRIAWGLERDPAKQPPQKEGAEPPEEEPVGSELPPGTYGVTVKFRGAEAKGSVRVIADPLARNTDADWAAREGSIERGRILQNALVAAIERIRDTRRDVDAVSERVKAANAERIREQTVEASDLPLVAQGEKLKEGLSKLERKLWQSPETPGILGNDDLLSRLGAVQSYVTSAWAPPSPTHLAYLADVETRLRSFLAELDAFFAGEVAGYRTAVQAGKIELLPQVAPIAVP